MEVIDELFGQFIRDQEILGQSETTINRYKNSFRYFRKLMPYATADNLNEGQILEFSDRMRQIVFWNPSVNDYINFQPATILNSVQFLRCFFIWLKNSGQVKYGKINSDNKELVPTMNKLVFLSIYRKKCKFLLNNHADNDLSYHTQMSNLNTELLVRQLCRRVNSFIHSDNPVFFSGVADYVQYIVGSNQLLDIVKNIILIQERNDFLKSKEWRLFELEILEEMRQNSVWGSWFNLEIVYCLIFRIREILNNFHDDSQVMLFLNKYQEEIQKILKNCSANQSKYFPRYVYNLDVIRVHNFLLEVLENKSELIVPKFPK